MTRLEFVRSAMLEIGLIQANEQPSAEVYNQSSEVLDCLLQSKAADLKNIFELKRAIFEIEPGKNIFTIGPDGDFDMVRPTRIDMVVLHTEFANDKYVTSALYPITLQENLQPGGVTFHGFEMQPPQERVTQSHIQLTSATLTESILRKELYMDDKVAASGIIFTGAIQESIVRHEVSSADAISTVNPSATGSIAETLVRVVLEKFSEETVTSHPHPILTGTLT